MEKGYPTIKLRTFSNEDMYYSSNPEVSSLMYCEIQPALIKYNPVDVLFICDCTSSMNIYLDKIKEAIDTFVEYVLRATSFAPRLGFLGFRDCCDNDQLFHIDFTNNIDILKQFISQIKCNGGGDTCEDLIAPLRGALGLSWKARNKYVYLLLEAPAHGRAYHTSDCDDSIPDADKDEMLEKIACYYKKMKINLIIIRCNPIVDMTIDVIRKYYDSFENKLIVIDFISNDANAIVAHFNSDIASSMSHSFSKSMYLNFRKIKRKMPFSEPLEIYSDEVFNHELKCKIYSGYIILPKYKKIMNKIMKKETELNYYITSNAEYTSDILFKVSKEKVGTGAFSECHFLISENKEKYVAKIPKKITLNHYELIGDIEATILASYFAASFSEVLEIKIFVLPLVIIQLYEKLHPIFKGSSTFLAQRFLEGEYTKYNNNFGWISTKITEANDIAQAFSHYTYQSSIGTLMIVDIQGVISDKGILQITDPAIHSEIYKDRFGPTNHGKFGIIKFFQTHICNDYCKKLMLTNPYSMDTTTLKPIMEKYKDKPILKHLYEKFETDVGKHEDLLKKFDPNEVPMFDSIIEDIEEWQESVSESLVNVSRFELEFNI